MYEVAALLNCLLCDSYFVFVVYAFDIAQFSGRKGKNVLDDLYEEISQLLANARFTLQRCPTCIEVTSDQKYSEWFASGAACVLSPCEYVKFDDAETDIPLYSAKNGEPHWTLCHGLAPKGLNLQKTSGRIYKRSFLEFFPNCSFTYPTRAPADESDETDQKSKRTKPQPKATDLVAPTRTPAEHTAMLELVFDALQCTTASAAASATPHELKTLTPAQRTAGRDAEWKRRFAEEFALFADLATNTAATAAAAATASDSKRDSKSAPATKQSTAKKPAAAAKASGKPVSKQSVADAALADAESRTTDRLGSTLLCNGYAAPPPTAAATPGKGGFFLSRTNPAVVKARNELMERLRAHKPVFVYWDQPPPPPTAAASGGKGSKPAPKAKPAAGKNAATTATATATAAAAPKPNLLGESLAAFVTIARAESAARAKQLAAESAAEVAASAIDDDPITASPLPSGSAAATASAAAIDRKQMSAAAAPATAATTGAPATATPAAASATASSPGSTLEYDQLSAGDRKQIANLASHVLTFFTNREEKQKIKAQKRAAGEVVADDDDEEGGMDFITIPKAKPTAVTTATAAAPATSAAVTDSKSAPAAPKS